MRAKWQKMQMALVTLGVDKALILVTPFVFFRWKYKEPKQKVCYMEPTVYFIAQNSTKIILKLLQ